MKHTSLKTSSHLFFLVVFSALALTTPLCGQNNQQQAQPKVIPPSPEASALAKYGNIPVSPYTGVPNISIPLYEIKARDITVPISISYHASGIKVSEEASRVGLGWVLNGGGVISRNVINLDDFVEQPVGYLEPTSPAPVLPFGPGIAPTRSLFAGNVVEFTNGDIEIDPNYVNHDFQPDQFSYNFLGYTGKFVLDREKKPVLGEQEKIRIRVKDDNASAWEVTTADGYIYNFSAFEYFVDYNNTQGYAQKSAWYLTEIVSPKGETVTFKYKTDGINFVHPAGSGFEQQSPITYSCDNFACQPKSTTQGVEPVAAKYYSTPYLEEIEWKFGKMIFKMEDRDDLEGDKRLGSIEVLTLDGALIRTIVFDYSYFVAAQVGNTFSNQTPPDKLTKRLKLNAVRIMGKPGTPDQLLHKFSYYEGGNLNLPPKNTFARDHWGYYNGRHGNSSLIPSYHPTGSSGSWNDVIGAMGTERNPSRQHVLAALLKEVQFPTGGRTTFHYESHEYEIDPTPPQREGEPFPVNTRMFYNGTNKGVEAEFELDLTQQYVTGTNKTIPIELSAAFRVGSACRDITFRARAYFEVRDMENRTLSRVDLNLENCSTADQKVCIYCDTQSQSPVFTYKNSYSFPPGKYKWVAFVEALPPGASQDQKMQNLQDISAMYHWWSKRPDPAEESYYTHGGGVRIARIEDYDPVTKTISNVRKFNYRYETDANQDGELEHHSFGKRMAKPEYSFFDFTWQNRQDLVTNNICFDCIHLVRQSESTYSVYGVNGSAVGYDKVIETFGRDGEFGSTVYEFHNTADTQIQFLDPAGTNIPLRPATVSSQGNPLNGKLKRKSTLGQSNTLLSREYYQYETKNTAEFFGMEIRKIPIMGQFGVTPTSNWMCAIYPAIQSAFVIESKKTTVEYFPSGDSVVVENSYLYENSDHLQLTSQITRLDNDHSLIKRFRYPADFTDQEATEAIKLMKGEKFMHGLLIEETALENLDGKVAITDKGITNYAVFAQSVFQKSKVKLNNNTALPEANVQPYVPTQPLDPAKFETEFELTYHDDGNIKEVIKPDDITVTYVWGYNHSFPVAEIRNATYQQVLAVLGQVTIDQLNNNPGTDEEVRSTLQVLRNAAALKDARIITYTYNPLYGITSSTDANGVTTYFEYDGLGRLQLQRNADHDIVKRWEYRHAAQK